MRNHRIRNLLKEKDDPREEPTKTDIVVLILGVVIVTGLILGAIFIPTCEPLSACI